MSDDVLKLPRGPLIVGIDGLALDEATRAQLQHPAVGGVILFARNYRDPEQLRKLTSEIKALRDPALLITVDQEGGRVQRFQDGFTRLPALSILGRWHARHPDRACDLAYRHGRVMAAELLAHGVDLSWAPVLDLAGGVSAVIGDRAMAESAQAVAELGAYYIAGMSDAGMAACGKHYPGHGSVAADTHVEAVVDVRDAAAVLRDEAPFKALAPRLAAVMMAHVSYEAMDPQPAGFSSYWIDQRLRRELGFEGVVVSDDLDMVGAAGVGGLPERLNTAFAAGCDVALVCQPNSVQSVLSLSIDWPEPPAERLDRLVGRPMASLEEQLRVPEFRAWRSSLQQLAENDPEQKQ